jgi:hypothetical protein
MSNVSNHHEQQNTVSEIALQIFLYRNTTIYIIPDSCSVFARNSFSYIKAAGANHSLYSSAKRNNLQSFTFIPSTCLHDMVCRDKASFIFLHDNCLHNTARVSMSPQQQWSLFMWWTSLEVTRCIWIWKLLGQPILMCKLIYMIYMYTVFFQYSHALF